MLLLTTKVFLVVVGMLFSAIAGVRFQDNGDTEGFILTAIAFVGLILGVFL